MEYHVYIKGIYCQITADIIYCIGPWYMPRIVLIPLSPDDTWQPQTQDLYHTISHSHRGNDPEWSHSHREEIRMTPFSGWEWVNLRQTFSSTLSHICISFNSSIDNVRHSWVGFYKNIKRQFSSYINYETLWWVNITLKCIFGKGLYFYWNEDFVKKFPRKRDFQPVQDFISTAVPSMLW